MDSVKTLTSTFIMFGHLPVELRDMIWELAASDCEPKRDIHFFSISPPTTAGAVTRLSRKESRNMSGYMRRAGICYACRESRSAVIRYQKYQANVEAAKVQEERPSHAAANVLTDIQHLHRYLVDIKRDLVVFRFPESTLAGQATQTSVYETCLRKFGRYGSFVGIEYDPEWFLHFSRFMQYRSRESQVLVFGCDLCTYWHTSPKARTGLAKAVEDLDHNEQSLWIIDNRLRPRDGVSRESLVENRLVFQGNGRSYVEVQLPLDVLVSDRDWSIRHARWQSPDESHSKGLRFVKRLAAKAGFWGLRFATQIPEDRPRPPCKVIR